MYAKITNFLPIIAFGVTNAHFFDEFFPAIYNRPIVNFQRRVSTTSPTINTKSHLFRKSRVSSRLTGVQQFSA